MSQEISSSTRYVRKGELTGNLRLGKFEVHYEEIFAEVIEDGVITVEERARLDKAADALGSIGNVFASSKMLCRPRTKRGTTCASAKRTNPRRRASCFARKSPGIHARSALEVHIAKLTARVAELERQLDEARGARSVEVDLSDMPAQAVEATEETVDELARRVRNQPRDVTTCAVFTARSPARGTPTEAGSRAHALSFLGAANPDELASTRSTDSKVSSSRPAP